MRVEGEGLRVEVAGLRTRLLVRESDVWQLNLRREVQRGLGFMF